MELEYIHTYYYFILGFLSVSIFMLLILSENKTKLYSYYKIASFFLLLFTIYYIGSRDISIGIDTVNYEATFLKYRAGAENPIGADLVFYIPFYILSLLSSYQIILYACAFAYLFISFKAYKIISSQKYIFYILFFIIYPYFFQYGINGMRNGISCALFILGVAYLSTSNSKKGFISMFLAAGAHFSMAFPLILYVLFKNMKIRFVQILFLFYISILFFTFMGINILNLDLLSNLVSADSKFSLYLRTAAQESVSVQQIIAFSMYSLPTALIGLYNLLYNKSYNIQVYVRIYSTFLVISIVYLLLINIPFSNRIAYVADFLMPIIILYPLLNGETIKKQNSIVDLFLFLIFIIFLFIKS